MRSLIEEGMNVARALTFHMEDTRSSLKIYDASQAARGDEASGRGSAGYKGSGDPSERVRKRQGGSLKNGQTFTLTTEDIVGDESRVAITYR